MYKLSISKTCGYNPSKWCLLPRLFHKHGPCQTTPFILESDWISSSKLYENASNWFKNEDIWWLMPQQQLSKDIESFSSVFLQRCWVPAGAYCPVHQRSFFSCFCSPHNQCLCFSTTLCIRLIFGSSASLLRL